MYINFSFISSFVVFSFFTDEEPHRVKNTARTLMMWAVVICARSHEIGRALGSRTYLEEHVNGKVEDWVDQVTKLAEFATSQPQACYAASRLL